MCIPTFAGCVTMIAVVLFGLRILINKAFANQQTQIDDLKRELEEMKRKRSEPQS